MKENLSMYSGWLDFNDREMKRIILITLSFFVFGVLWILTSDFLLLQIGRIFPIQELMHLGVFKGILFILISSLFIFLLLERLHLSQIKQEVQYRKLFDENMHPMWIYDVDTLRFLCVNRGTFNLYGYSEADFRSMIVTNLSLPEDKDYESQHINNVKVGKHRTGVMRHVRKDGTLLHIDISGFGIEFEGRRAELILAYDITKQVEAEKQLKNYTVELETKIKQRTIELEHVNRELEHQISESSSLNNELILVNERLQAVNRKLVQSLKKEKELVDLKSKFVSIASHEFRTPLATIHFASDFIKRYQHKLKPEEIEQKIVNIQSQISHMTSLLDDVLTIGKSDSGKLQVNLADVNISNFFYRVIEEIEHSTHFTHKIIHRIEPQNSVVITDEKLLRNITTNLLINAIKFSPSQNHIDIVVIQTTDRISITVRDYGIGIAEAEQMQIFDPFHRASNSKAIPGTGLGLSIVKRSVELLNGEIQVFSQVGTGTTFTVTLPLPPMQ